MPIDFWRNQVLTKCAFSQFYTAFSVLWSLIINEFCKVEDFWNDISLKSKKEQIKVLCPGLGQNLGRGIAGILTKTLRRVILAISPLRINQYLGMVQWSVMLDLLIATEL